jgi:hypothetical protein
MAANVELWINVDDVYHPALSVAVDTCELFSLHPLTWLRYLGFTICGNEGRISTLPDGVEVDYYQANIQPGVYYYVSQGESFRHARTPRSPSILEAFLLDPDLMDDRTSDASDISTSRGDFRDRVVARDGTCVMTGAANC